MTKIDTYQKGNFKLEEWEDVNYCEHRFYKNDKGLTDEDIVDLLNEQENKLNQIKKLCMDNRIPVCLTAHIPKSCEHYHACFENHTENAVSFGESKIANKILKIINGDVE